METREILYCYINQITSGSSYNGDSPLAQKVKKTIKENKDLSDVDLLKKIEEEFGPLIELNAKYAHIEKINSIKKWTMFIGFIFILEIVAAFIWAIISTSAVFK